MEVREGYWKGKECKLDYLVKRALEIDSHIYKVYCYQTGKYHVLENKEQKRNFIDNHIYVATLENMFQEYMKKEV